jgi:uncharacterized phage-associated protein
MTEEGSMADVFDVAQYILQKLGPTSAMKLQKLVYYSQAWSLVWHEKPLFPERIEAWANGPVVPILWDSHKGQFVLTQLPKGNANRLSEVEKKTVNAVLDYYGDKTAQYLCDVSHMEEPWSKTRKGLGPGTNSRREITHSAMHEYYCSIPPKK